MRLGSWKSQIGLAVMMVISGPAFAKLPKGDISSADATDPSTRSCGKDTNKITFNADGEKDYYIGRDIENDGGGTYFSAQGGEIVTTQEDAQGNQEFCVQTGMRLKTGTKADAGNQMGPKTCGTGINQTHKVDDGHGSYKEYRWMWDQQNKKLKIAPVNANGSWGKPVLVLGGGTKKPQGEDHKGYSWISVTVEDPTAAGSGAKGFTVEMKSKPSGSQPKGEKTCLLGKLDSKSQQNINISYSEDDGVQRTIDSQQSAMVQNTSRASN